MESIVRVKKKCIEKCLLRNYWISTRKCQGERQKVRRTGNDRIRDIGWRSSSDCYFGYYDFQTKNPRIMGCNFLGYQWALTIKRCCVSQARGLLNMQLFLLRFFP